jgi:RHS repeat-associated protein
VGNIQSSWVDLNHPQYVAQSISYMPWGTAKTLVNGCAGGGCVDTEETYLYNNRLQPLVIELGTAANPTADSCLVYNYYAGASNPTSCARPTQGTNDNGNVASYFDQDGVNGATFNHTATYTYDNVDRLTSASATGNATYNLTFNYDQYGNMNCVTNGQTNGPCPTWTASSANNQMNSSQGFVYDAAGNLTNDPTGAAARNYTWDAEGRLTQVTDHNGGATTTSYVYNALGQDVEVQTAGGWRLEAIFDPQGQRLGYYSVNYSQWLLGYVHWQGRELAKYSWSNEFDFFHPNSLGSAGMTTQPSGNVWDDMLFYPWREVWLNAGTNTFDTHFASIHASLQGSNLIDWTMYEADHRFYAPNPGRWHSPDPGGRSVVKLDDPQTWNMYAYVRNNPTTLVDPTGLCTDPVSCTLELGAFGSLAGPTGTVVGAVAGLVLGGFVAYEAGKEVRQVLQESAARQGTAGEDSSAASGRPGRLGNPDHQETAEQERARVDGRREVPIKTPGGSKETRWADAAKVDENGKVIGEVVQVFRPTPAGNIPKREREAAEDIEKATGVKPTMVPVRPSRPKLPCEAAGTCQLTQ